MSHNVFTVTRDYEGRTTLSLDGQVIYTWENPGPHCPDDFDWLQAVAELLPRPTELLALCTLTGLICADPDCRDAPAEAVALCPFCGNPVDEDSPNCCGEVGHIRWATQCSRCEEPLVRTREDR